MKFTKEQNLGNNVSGQLISSLCRAHLSDAQIERLSEESLVKSSNLAYAIQHIIINEKIHQNNENIIGYKMCVLHKKNKAPFGNESPVYGTLTNSNLSSGIIILDNMREPLIEMELMFIINEDLSAYADEEEIVAKTSIAPGIEIPDSHFYNWYPYLSISELIADNCASGKIIVGKAIKSSTINRDENFNATLYYNGEILENSGYSISLENALKSVKSINRLVSQLASDGIALKKGMIISSGTSAQPKALYRGEYKAVYDGLGEVTLLVR